MPLEFRGDAICLSGLTGTKIKCDVIGAYYPFWWRITSGGPRRYHVFPTTIVELNAATGEVYIEDTGSTVLGSAGHALALKMTDSFDTRSLKVVLIEEDRECYRHLKQVIRRRFPNVSLNEIEGPIHQNSSNIYLLNQTLDEALRTIIGLDLGNALFFFDPLRNVQFPIIENVASNRIPSFYKRGTEFLLFVFTSDWLLGREALAPLPTTLVETEWTDEEAETVMQADFLFGGTNWRSHVLNDNQVDERQRTLIGLYRKRLHKWFRYVLPLPFSPRKGQVFHLVLCSNYHVGVRRTRDFFCEKTKNPRYAPDNQSAFLRFKALHPDCFKQVDKRKRPLEWLILWHVIKGNEEGICDAKCKGLEDHVSSLIAREHILEWLTSNGYFTRIKTDHIWDDPIPQYQINWTNTQQKLGVMPPQELVPL